ncbi:MAG: single-stranded DNA-binding protein [Planctomycetaceae bacterium]
MASYNRVILIGNLTRDPEVKYIPSGMAVAEIGLAVNRYFNDKSTNERKEETTFVDVTLWGRQAELAGEYLAKGRPVMIEGRLQLDTWEDKQSGQKRSKLRVVGETMQFLGSGPGEGGGGGGSRGGAGRGNRGQAPASGGNSGGDDFYSGSSFSGGGAPDDDVPF